MSSSLMFNLWLKQKEGVDTDCKFILTSKDSETGKDEEVVVHAHRLILSTASPAIGCMLKSEWNGDKPILLPDVKPATFQKFMQLIYVNYADIESVEEALELYCLTHMFGLFEIFSIVSSCILEKFLTVATFILVAKQAALVDDSKIKEACMKLFRENASEILTQETFSLLPASLVNAWFAMNPLNITNEYELVKALETYVTTNNEMNENILEMVRPAMSSIRFLLLSEEEVQNTFLLSDLEKHHVLASKKNHTTLICNTLSPNRACRARVVKQEIHSNNSYLTSLPGKVIVELYKKLSDFYCWYCNAKHSGILCCEVNKRFRFYKNCVKQEFRNNGWKSCIRVNGTLYEHTRIEQYQDVHVKTIVQEFCSMASHPEFAEFLNV